MRAKQGVSKQMKSKGITYHVDVEPAIVVLGHRVWNREVS